MKQEAWSQRQEARGMQHAQGNGRRPMERFERRPRNHFEVLLHRWRLGDEVKWGDLFAAWVQAPLAPGTPDVIRRVIRKVERAV